MRYISINDLNNQYKKIKSNFVSKIDFKKALEKVETPVIDGGDINLDGYATKSWVEGKGYLTEHQSLSGYAKKSEIPTVDGLVSKQYVDTAVGELNEKIDGITIEGGTGYDDTEIRGLISGKADKDEIPSLEGYVTESWVEGKGYLTEHQSLAGYVLKSEIPSLDGYATEEMVSNEVTRAKEAEATLNARITSLVVESGGYDDTELRTLISGKADKSEIPSIAGLATESWVEGKGYLTEHQSLDGYAKTTDIPKLDGYATESWVNSKGYLTEHQSLAGYAKSSEIPSLDGYASESFVTEKIANVINNAPEAFDTLKEIADWISSDVTRASELATTVAGKADKSEIPSLDGYATESWVNGKGYLTEHQSLVGYAKSSEIPSLDGYVTESWVNGKGYLTEHQSLVNYALKSEIPTVSVLENTDIQSVLDEVFG